MNTIVERLRYQIGRDWEYNNPEMDALLGEAANEIDRLEAKVQDLEQRVDYLEDHYEDR